MRNRTQVTILFKVKKVENGTRRSYIFNGRPIESRMCSVEQRHFSLLLTWFSRSRHSLTPNISQTANDTSIVTTKRRMGNRNQAFEWYQFQ